MRLLRGLIFGLLLCVGLNTALAAPVPTELKKIVTFVFLADENGTLKTDPVGNPSAYGTAFFVIVPRVGGASPGLGTVYLVSAKHVLQDSSGQWLRTFYLRLDRKEGNAEFVRVDPPQAFFLTHPDPTVDVVALPFLPPQSLYDFKAIPTSMFATAEKLEQLHVSEGSDVFFTGLMVAYYGDEKNTPVTRFGRVAMFPDQPIPWALKPGVKPQKERLYLLETQSFGGNSGSPVFFYLGVDSQPGTLRLGSEIVFAGVMHGTFENARALEIVPNANLPIYKQNIGIAAVTPGYFLSEILDSERAKNDRAEEWKKYDAAHADPAPTGSVPPAEK